MGTSVLGPGIGTGVGALAGWGLGHLFGGKQPQLQPGPVLPPSLGSSGYRAAPNLFGSPSIPTFGGSGNPFTASAAAPQFTPSPLPSQLPAAGLPAASSAPVMTSQLPTQIPMKPLVQAPAPTLPTLHPAVSGSGGGAPAYLANMNWSGIGGANPFAGAAGIGGASWGYGDLRNPFSSYAPATSMWGPMGDTF